MEMTVAELLTAIAARVLTLTGWTRSAFTFDALGRDPSSVAHLAFAVGRPQTQFLSRQAGRVVARTDVTIRFTARVRPKDVIGSETDALDAEGDLLACLLDSSRAMEIVARLATSTATEAGDFWRHDLTLSVLHSFPLST